MHGHGYPQPVKQPPPTLWLVLLRVVFVTLSIISFGFLAWTMLLRLAVVTRKMRDWILLGALIAIDIVAVGLLGSEPGEEIHTPGGWLGLFLLLGSLVASIAYYLVAEIRHFQRLRHGAGAYGAGQTPIPGQGYPQRSTPYPATTAPQTPAAPHFPPPMPQAAADRAPIPTRPQRPAPARIDQVRAELDELSDYLRKHDGNHESGR
ncbi:hypothetical protein QQY66_19495 [Streptomyces sp. DG2A-72]|uniref:hypothetical protein n=1 Tax=Streptomyces sp. DG2A-72 TaxID=3051386 RepID=UPI00265BACD3|nr:hypothetical protein [Streptomyces sp. DG2A-72]MDO0933762.1 hypothetical protein [Streptomyces sp. DG2A-72]